MVYALFALKSFSRASSLDCLDLYCTVTKRMEELVKRNEISVEMFHAGSVLLTALENHNPTSDHFTARLFDQAGWYAGGIHFSKTRPVEFRHACYDSKKSNWRGTNLSMRAENMEDFRVVIVRELTKAIGS